MRRALLGVAGAAVVLTGCAATPVPVPGEAAPVVAVTGSTQSPATSSPTARAASPSRTPSPTPAPSTSSAAPQLPPPLPKRYQTLAMTGFGASISLPVPAGWTSSDHDSDQRRNTDLVPPQAPDLLLLRIDLTARGPGSAEDGAKRVEAAITSPRYRRLAFTAVPGVGDDAVDWYFTFDQDGRGMWVCDRQILAGTAGIAVYLRVPYELRETYRPLLRTVLDGLRIKTS